MARPAQRDVPADASARNLVHYLRITGLDCSQHMASSIVQAAAPPSTAELAGRPPARTGCALHCSAHRRQQWGSTPPHQTAWETTLYSTLALPSVLCCALALTR